MHVLTWSFFHSLGLKSCHSSGSLERLSQMFELPLKEVHSVVSRMIIKEELLVSNQCYIYN